MNQAKKITPAGNQGDSQKLSGDTPSLAPEHAGLVSGVHVVVVQIKGTGHDGNPPRYRRRVFLSLAAGQRAIDRATADGLEASIILCQLTPLGGGIDD